MRSVKINHSHRPCDMPPVPDERDDPFCTWMIPVDQQWTNGKRCDGPLLKQNEMFWTDPVFPEKYFFKKRKQHTITVVTWVLTSLFLVSGKYRTFLSETLEMHIHPIPNNITCMSTKTVCPMYNHWCFLSQGIHTFSLLSNISIIRGGNSPGISRRRWRTLSAPEM